MWHESLGVQAALQQVLPVPDGTFGTQCALGQS
jgi:hypothetical protein